MTPVYIAGPYAADTPAEMAENVRRANALCLYAVWCGFAPITVHAAVLAGAYGDEAIESDRERGIRVDLALVELVAKAGGQLWAIEREDGSLSSGTAREVGRFCAYKPLPAEPHLGVRRVPWSVWSARIEQHSTWQSTT